MAVDAFWLQKYLMSFAIAKPKNLVFNRRTITRPPPLNIATKKRRAMEACTDDIVRLGIGA